MVITKIEVQKKNKERVNLYIDNEFYCGLSLETIIKNHIKENKEISQTQIDFLKNNSEIELATNKAVGYISKCQKTEKEIKIYLLKKGFDEEVIQTVISKLKNYNFVDDELYTKNYIKFKNKNNGVRKLEMELRNRGVNEKLVKESLEELSCDRENILSVAEKYLRLKDKDLKTKQKAYRFLLSRGYQLDDIVYALDKLFKEE